MIIVHGRATSSNVQVVMWAIGELGLPYERRDVGGRYGGTDTPEYRAMNPNGRVPTIQDGALTMFESPAILRYLSGAYGSDPFWPDDMKRRAELDMWAEWTKTSFCTAFAHDIFWPLIRTRAADRDPRQVARGEAELARLAPMIDRRVGKGPWLGGEDFTFADVMLGHILYRYFDVDFARVPTANLEAYYRRCAERPAYREHVMVSYDSLRVA
jgi:glutathione S-transferase